MLYLDVETYSPDVEPAIKDKVITIQYQEIGWKQPLILKEWEKCERDILQDFHDYLHERLRAEPVYVIGFNLFRFDIPILIYKLTFFKIEVLENLLENIRNIYWRDLRYCLYPYNNLSFEGLSEYEVAIKLNIPPPKYSSKEIAKFYDEKKYEKIVEHILSEFKFFQDLNWKLTNEPNVVKMSLQKTVR